MWNPLHSWKLSEKQRGHSGCMSPTRTASIHRLYATTTNSFQLFCNETCPEQEQDLSEAAAGICGDGVRRRTKNSKLLMMAWIAFWDAPCACLGIAGTPRTSANHRSAGYNVLILHDISMMQSWVVDDLQKQIQHGVQSGCYACPRNAPWRSQQSYG